MTSALKSSIDVDRRRAIERAKAAMLGMSLAAVLATTPVSADDSEIFFGQVSRNANTNPNVLFVLDTSGSMKRTDDTGISRLDRLKAALFRVVDKTSNANVGLMRFQGSQGGSSVIFPLTPIDGDMCDYDDCADTELLVRAAHEDDDTAEMLNGMPATSEMILSMGADIVDQRVGVRFGDVNIPQGATVTSAKLEFVSHLDILPGTANLEIASHDLDDAPRFSDANSSLADRPTSTSVDWSVPSWIGGERYSSVDISSEVQKVVNRTGWCGGNGMSFEITGNGSRGAYSYEYAVLELPMIKDANANDAPVLRVTYDQTSIPAAGGCRIETLVKEIASGADDGEQNTDDDAVDLTSSDLELPRDSSDEQIIGLRFDQAGIPSGTTINEAYIEFQIDEPNRYLEDVSLWIDVEQAVDASGFSSSSKGVHDDDRPLSGSAIPWNDLPLPEREGEKLYSPDITPLLQGLVGQSGWSDSSPVVVKLWRKGGTGSRTVESFNGTRSGAAKLIVRFKVPSGDSLESSSTSVRNALNQAIIDIDHASGTPIVDALYEAGLYFIGAPVDYGLQRGADGNLQSANRVSAPRSWTGGTIESDSECEANGPNSSDCVSEHLDGNPSYVSPMASSCQSNHIVLLSDGEASSISSQSKIRSLTGVDSCTGSGNEACGRELATWLYENDHAASVPEKQNVKLHTVGFNLENNTSAVNFSTALANNGGGGFYEAEDADDLVAVFDRILGAAQSIDTSFVAPGTTVNQFNRLTHRNDVYFALFKPESRPEWDGNLKRYEIGTAGSADDDTLRIAILDKNGDLAVDESTGFFDKEATSFWSSGDGSSVALGGAAMRLTARGDTARRLFTYVGAESALSGTATVALDDDANRLHEDNDALTAQLLGLSDDADDVDVEKLLRWVRGQDRLDLDLDEDVDEQRGHIGDPMHSRPVILNYAKSSDDDDDAWTTVFLGSNEGFLHAIDRDEGDELYAFMPKELLSNLPTLASGDASLTHPYGLDGALSVWTDDKDNDTIVDADESAFLYVGMRRGGSSYYGFDVSNRTAPKLAWVIHGGDGGTAGFEELGQSWSRPVPTSIMVDGTKRDVLVFGAGYAETQDPAYDQVDKTRVSDDIGRGFFFVDAKTGELVHSVLHSDAVSTAAASKITRHSALEHSVPGDLRVIDVDFDGMADQLWFGDTGGRLWRFDVEPYHQTGTLLHGGVMAALGGGDYADNRRFYYEPDISLVGSEGNRFLSIGIGSGWRAHPLNKIVQDRFYVLRSDAIYKRPDGYGKPGEDEGTWEPITDDDLVDVTDDMTPAIGAYGWYLNLESPGEKVLDDSITVNNQVVFTSYLPEPDVDNCTTAIGGGRVYALSVFDGSPTLDRGTSGADKDDRWVSLIHGGIPPGPAALITENGPTIMVGPEQPLDLDFDNLTQRSYWRDNGRQKSIIVSEDTSEETGDGSGEGSAEGSSDD